MRIELSSPTGLSAAVQTVGSEVVSLVTPGGTQLIWQGDKHSWNESSPLLFPIVGESPRGTVQYGNLEYRSQRHGFARFCDFAVASSSASFAHMELTATDQTKLEYPFDFHLRSGIILDEKGVTLEYTISNIGEGPMPFGFGIHPGFNFSLADGRTCLVTFERPEQPEVFGLDAAGLLRQTTGVRRQFDTLKLSARHLIDGPLILGQIRSRKLTLRSGGQRIEMRWSGFTRVVFWSKPPWSFLCCELVTSLPPTEGDSDINRRPGVTWLQPGDGANYDVHLTAD